MNQSDWNKSTDIGLMLEELWTKHKEEKLVPILHEFLLKCARNIEVLLPQKDSVRGIEIGEKYLSGEVDEDVLSDENWAVEGAAFCIDYNTEPEMIQPWIKNTELIPNDEIDRILSGENITNIDTRRLLLDAAYFTDHAMIFPTCSHKNQIRESYVKFMHPEILMGIVANPEILPNKNSQTTLKSARLL